MDFYLPRMFDGDCHIFNVLTVYKETKKGYKMMKIKWQGTIF